MTAFIIFGVSGSGKSTVGQLSAARLELPFIEGDDYHPTSNIAKMSQGIPLTDDERMPWIDRLSEAVNASPAAHAVIACSALTHRVRQRLRQRIEQPVCFIHLTAPVATVQARLQQRPQHFMKPGMLHSQLLALERTHRAITIDAAQPLAIVVECVVAQLQQSIAAAERTGPSATRRRDTRGQ